MKVGDAIIYRKSVSWGKKAYFGLIICTYTCGDEPYAEVLWADGKITWEEWKTSAYGSSFEVISESR